MHDPVKWHFFIRYCRCESLPAPHITLYIAADANVIKDQVLRGDRPELRFVPAEIPDFLRQVIVSCWAQNPKDRPRFSGLWTYAVPCLYSLLVLGVEEVSK